MLWRPGLLVVLLLSLVAPAFADAENGALRRLLAADEARAWRAVGRVNVAGAGFCTGALIAEDLVLTAAHCVFFKRTGNPVPPEKIHFLAGWRKGRAAAHRKAQRILVHPDYRYDDKDRLSQVSADIALIELESPIRASVIEPFERYSRPRPGEKVTVVSYARDRSEAPSLQDSCEMLGRQSEVLVLTCDVNFGASGAPIFVMDGETPKIASVVSAMARWNGEDVALGTSLGTPLDFLMAEFAASDPIFNPKTPGVSRLPQVGVTEESGQSFKRITVPDR